MKASKKIMIIAIALLAAILLVTLCACNSDPQAADPTPEHTHTFAEGWTYNDEYHWHASTCGHAEETKDKAEHQLSWETTMPATCEAKGKQTGSCICGYTETRSIDMAEHSWGKWTSNDDKTHTRTCSKNSAHTETKPCSFDSVVTPPSCTAQGYTTYTCKDCGYSYTSDPTPKTDHTYGSDGTCTECGAPDPSHSAEVSDAELIAALKKNCETQLSNLFMDNYELTFNLSKVENDSWYIEEERNNIIGGTYTLFYNRSTSSRYFIAINLKLNKSISKNDLVKNNLEGVTFTLSEIYHISYNPSIQPNNAELTDAIFDALGVDDTGAERIIIDQGLNTFDGDLGQAHAYIVIEISEIGIKERAVNIKDNNDTFVYNLKNKKFKEFIEIRKDIEIEGTKLVPEI